MFVLVERVAECNIREIFCAAMTDSAREHLPEVQCACWISLSVDHSDAGERSTKIEIRKEVCQLILKDAMGVVPEKRARLHKRCRG